MGEETVDYDNGDDDDGDHDDDDDDHDDGDDDDDDDDDDAHHKNNLRDKREKPNPFIDALAKDIKTVAKLEIWVSTHCSQRDGVLVLKP
ncbi:hypothetical protein PoB_000543600 [Plakobranchus ocellatus]|uniref:Uncharacterized protein n=1 Tax=Plakobranchus ocellatus TaxID=259542 RepID=A0AAV3Y6T3_9GAST|nr:hypothetical protein PoB_000543600 [Plakobranchus ocellatus]